MLTMPNQQRPDILVTGQQGQPLVLVEVKRIPFDQNARRQIERYVQEMHAEFVMAVDPKQIQIAKTRNGMPDWKRGIKLQTSAILGHYTDVQDLERIEGFYLQSLVEAWLSDFSFSWKSQVPPGYEELSRLGLAASLRNSETHTRET